MDNVQSLYQLLLSVWPVEVKVSLAHFRAIHHSTTFLPAVEYRYYPTSTRPTAGEDPFRANKTRESGQV
jgi:hypothetical protein